MKAKLFGVGVVVVIVAAAAYLFLGSSSPFVSGAGTYSDGYRSGYVVKMSFKGTALKAWEGQMILGPYPTGFAPADIRNGDPGANVFEFSIEGDKDDAMAKKVLDAQIGMKYCTLHYDQKRIKGRGTDTSYLIVDVLLPPH